MLTHAPTGAYRLPDDVTGPQARRARRLWANRLSDEPLQNADARAEDLPDNLTYER